MGSTELADQVMVGGGRAGAGDGEVVGADVPPPPQDTRKVQVKMRRKRIPTAVRVAIPTLDAVLLELTFVVMDRIKTCGFITDNNVLCAVVKPSRCGILRFTSLLGPGSGGTCT